MVDRDDPLMSGVCRKRIICSVLFIRLENALQEILVTGLPDCKTVRDALWETERYVYAEGRELYEICIFIVILFFRHVLFLPLFSIFHLNVFITLLVDLPP